MVSLKPRPIRIRLSKIRALLGMVVGRETGFFAQYDYADTIEPIPVYPGIEQLCEACDPGPILDVMGDADFSDPFWREDTRHMGLVDVAVDHAVLRHLGIRRVLEIGSGRSTHVIARSIPDGGSITCIDPAPRLDISGLPVRFEKRVLRAEDADLAATLGEGDCLFIDSSHILHAGTDVDIEFNLLFPALRAGALVHVHDIFLPYAYPDAWRGRGWNEAQALAPWLLSGSFEIVFPTHWMLTRRNQAMQDAVPTGADCSPYAGGSFWIRKR